MGILAHLLSGGGPLNVVLLLLGAVLAFGGIRLRDKGGSSASVGRALTVVGIAMFGLGLVIDTGPTPSTSSATVRIVQPSPGQDVPAGEPIDVVVELDNGSIALSPSDTSGGHLHLWVDGEVRRMPYATEARITLDPGVHEIEAEFVDYRHVSFSPEVSTAIEVRAT